MNLLVTGGAGFIGSHFVLRHKEQYPDDLIVVLDKMTYAANKAFLDPVLNRIRFVEGDIADPELVTSILGKYAIDAIVNFAAETHVDRSIENAVPFLYTNVLGVHSLIEVCRHHPQVLLLHISTDEVYGDQGEDEPPRKEEDPLRPSSPYAASKASGDLLLLSAARTYGMRLRITRCTNNYGPHQALEKFIPTVIRSALRGQKIPVYGQGKNRRDWLYVGDHCDGVELVLHHADLDGQIVNISAGAEKENIEVAKTILDVLGKPHDLISFVTDRPGHDWRYAVDSSKIRSLGWSPKVSFEEGMKKTVEWYKNSIPHPRAS